MGEQINLNFSAFGTELNAGAFACFRALYVNAQNSINKSGPQATYEKPLEELLEASGNRDVAGVANSIREILQCKVECRQGDYRYFFPFFTSVCIENGMVKYGVQREIESAITRIPVPGI